MRYDGIFSPIPRPGLIARRLASGKCVLSPIGLEKRCIKCNEYWPADSEFYFTQPKKPDGLSEWCKACWKEWYQARALQRQQPAAA